MPSQLSPTISVLKLIQHSGLSFLSL